MSRILILLLVLPGLFFTGTAHGATPRGSVLREAFRTDAIEEELRYEIYLPPGHRNGEGLPYLLFLPGYKDNETFCRKKGFFEITERMIREGSVPPIAVVCVGRGRAPSAIWVDTYAAKAKHETALVRDLLGRLEQAHRFSADRAERSILGISIGGYAALKISLRHPDLFGSVSAFSPALDPHYEEKVRAGQYPWDPGSPEERRQSYGPEFDAGRALREDPFWLVKNRTSPVTARYFLVCGEQDRHGLAEPLDQFKDLLVREGADVTGGLEKGNHVASFWRRMYPAALRFHSAR